MSTESGSNLNQLIHLLESWPRPVRRMGYGPFEEDFTPEAWQAMRASRVPVELPQR